MGLASRKHTIVMGVFSVVLCVFFAFATIEVSYADEVGNAADTIENTAIEYNKAVRDVAQLENRISQNQQKVIELQKKIKEQQGASKEALKSLYIYQRQSSALINLVFSTDDVRSLFGTIDYLSRYEDRNFQVLKDQIEAKEQLEAALEQLNADKAVAEQTRDAAKTALLEAQKIRTDAMAKAETEAEAQLEAAKAAGEGVEEAAKAIEEVKKARVAAATSAATVAAQTEVPNGVVDTSAVDWSLSYDEFVAGWTDRINAYLDGSPLAGYGRQFAVAAWNYGVDPRWSPAISTVESSKGKYCFMKNNAWGWGQSAWSSWEEAIDAHINGLSRLYGPTVTLSFAKKYCPPNSTHWYNRCVVEMSKI